MVGGEQVWSEVCTRSEFCWKCLVRRPRSRVQGAFGGQGSSLVSILNDSVRRTSKVEAASRYPVERFASRYGVRGDFPFVPGEVAKAHGRARSPNNWWVNMLYLATVQRWT